MWGHLEIAVFLPLAGYLVMIDLAHHGSKVDRGVLENVIRFAGVLLLLPAMYFWHAFLKRR
jgi:hypothetical protein